MEKAAICFVISLFLVPQLALSQESPAEAVIHEVRITVKKFEYHPNEIHVKQGERVRLLLTALDRKHGFEMKELGIKTELEKAKETAVEFVATRAGEFQFQCSVFCGLGHRRVKGKLIVEPAGSNP